MPKDDRALLCPKCNKEISPAWMIGIRNYSARTLNVPYFICGTCGVIHVSKTAVRRAISAWRSDLSNREREHAPSYKELYREMMETLERVVMATYCRTSGYRRAKFLKIPNS